MERQEQITLSHFRADSIVADCEYFRKSVFGGTRWETLGQSYVAEFLTLTYLSHDPEGLAACMSRAVLQGSQSNTYSYE